MIITCVCAGEKRKMVNTGGLGRMAYMKKNLNVRICDVIDRQLMQ